MIPQITGIVQLAIAIPIIWILNKLLWKYLEEHNHITKERKLEGKI